MTAEGQSRARDPGLKLGQLGSVVWVHCPKCDGPAKTGPYGGVSCLKCGHATVPKRGGGSGRWARIKHDDPRCGHCGHALPTHALPTGFVRDQRQYLHVQCPLCRKAEDYPAQFALPPNPSAWPELVRMRLYLATQVGGETLWVDNLAHLAALEDYLGAKVRERSAGGGMTMMARLPAWMKAATMRPKIVRGLRHLRERAEQAGIDE